MIYTRILVILLFVTKASSWAGDTSMYHYAGIPTVDFFAHRSIASTIDNPITLQRYQGISEVSSDGEKSPWIASLLSLAIPGTGEVYTGDYLKGALFFAAEAASWIIVYAYDKKGDRQTDLYHDYANQHYSVVRYANWTLDNLGTLHPTPLPRTRDEYQQWIYGNNPNDPLLCGPPFSCVNWVALNEMERNIASGVLNGYTHVLPYYNEQQYYELIGKYDQFSRGWDDADLDPNAPLNADDPSSQVIKSNSKRFYEYAAMRAQANNYYDVASTFISVVVVNHVLSALDAFWSANRYNKSFHAELRMKVQPTNFGLIPMTQANFMYEF